MSSPYLSQLLQDLKTATQVKRKPKKEPPKVILESPEDEDEEEAFPEESASR